jgi:hypothetical protein
MPRAHLYVVAQDPAGNAIENATVRLLQPGTTNLIADPIYPDSTTPTAGLNPFVTATGMVSVYLDTPQRVRIGVAPPGAAERFIEDIDIGASGAAGGTDNHVGAGTNSTTLGLGATSDGANASAFGQGADADGSYGTALGRSALAAGADATAVGGGATGPNTRASAFGRSAAASATDATAVGASAASSNTNTTSLGSSAVANSDKSTAIGKSATAGHDHATAVGAEAVTTEPGQVMLGTSTDFAEAPGSYLLTTADGRRGKLRLLPDGTLTSIWHVPSTATNILPALDSDFETGTPTWASVAGLTSVAASTDFALVGTKSLKFVLSGTGTGSARTAKYTGATVGGVYVGRGRIFYNAGAMTAGQNATLWLEFWTSGDVLVGSAFQGTARLMYANAWIYYDVRAVAPATTAKVSLRAGLPTGGGAATNAFYLDSAGIYLIPGATV